MTFFVKEDSPIRQAKDLIGKKVAPGEGKAGALAVRDWDEVRRGVIYYDGLHPP